MLFVELETRTAENATQPVQFQYPMLDGVSIALHPMHVYDSWVRAMMARGRSTDVVHAVRKVHDLGWVPCGLVVY